MESASYKPWVHRKKWGKENHRKVFYPSTFIEKTKKKHPVKPSAHKPSGSTGRMEMEKGPKGRCDR
jgi:hypothetical protein